MRDLETMTIALTAAETGHLVLSTLHTTGAANTIDRIIDVFPHYQHQQVKVQLSSVLQAVISQQLISRKDRAGRVVATEIMMTNIAIKNIIREGKTNQIDSVIQSGSKLGMQSMDMSLINIYTKGIISYEDTMALGSSPENMQRLIRL
jgi:twitching motility protein PilT